MKNNLNHAEIGSNHNTSLHNMCVHIISYIYILNDMYTVCDLVFIRIIDSIQYTHQNQKPHNSNASGRDIYTYLTPQ